MTKEQFVAGVEERHIADVVGEIELRHAFLNAWPVGIVVIVDEYNPLRNGQLHRNSDVIHGVLGHMTAIDAEKAEAAARSFENGIDMPVAYHEAVGPLDDDGVGRHAAFGEIADEGLQISLSGAIEIEFLHVENIDGEIAVRDTLRLEKAYQEFAVIDADFRNWTVDTQPDLKVVQRFDRLPQIGNAPSFDRLEGTVEIFADCWKHQNGFVRFCPRGHEWRRRS